MEEKIVYLEKSIGIWRWMRVNELVEQHSKELTTEEYLQEIGFLEEVISIREI